MAVHTVISKSNVEKILTKYSIGRLEYFNGIKDGIENTNYLIVTSKNKFILKIKLLEYLHFSKEHHSKAGMSQIALMLEKN